jgi:cell division protein FtsA
MVNNNYIAAIDLGTSRFLGMVGQKNPDGSFHVLAKDSRDSKKFMRYGRITGMNDASMCVGMLIKGLENIMISKVRATGLKIEKVYIGVCGQSLRSVECSVARIIHELTVTEEDIQALNEDCRTYSKKIEGKVYGILPPVYYLDGVATGNPLGAMCSQLKASYQLIVGWPAIGNLARDAVKTAGYACAGAFVSPLSLAEAILDPEERESGCILIHLDFGVTAVTVYKDNSLVYFAVIPFGHNLITKDLSEGLNLSETDAETLKNDYANVAADGNKTPSGAGNIEYIVGGRKLDSYKTDMIAGARARELVENVYGLLKAGVLSNPFDGCIKLTGEAAGLKGMAELIASRFKLKVVRASAPRVWNDVEKEYLTAAALLAEGTENCVKSLVKPAPPVIKPEPGADDNKNGVNSTGKDPNVDTGKKTDPDDGTKIKKNFLKTMIGMFDTN